MPYVQTRLGRWFYEETGRARKATDPAIVLLHGLLFDASMWDGQKAALAAQGRVLAFDGPGHGRSEDPPPFSLDDHTRAVLDALGTLGASSALVIGLSWGGMIALRLALAAPEKVRGLVVLDSTAAEESPFQKVRYRAMASFTHRLGMPRALFRREVAPLLFSDRSRALNPALEEDAARGIDGASREGLYRAVRAVLLDRKPILDKLSGVRVKTLVVCGEADRAQPLLQSRAIAEAIPGARLEVVPGAGHMTALEKPAEVASLLSGFVSERLATA